MIKLNAKHAIAFIFLATFILIIYHLQEKISYLATNKLKQLQKLFSKFKFQHEENITLWITNFTDGWTTFESDIYVYSAYLDNRFKINGCVIKIIAMGQRVKPIQPKINCFLQHQNISLQMGHLNPKIIPEDHGKLYTAMFYYCFSRQCSKSTSVGMQKSSSEILWLPIRALPVISTSPSIAVCVRPLFGPYRDTFKMAEFLSYYDAVSVKHFVFYNYQMSAEVGEFLELLKSKGFSIEILPWNLPFPSSRIWEQGQVASIQDCIYHLRHRFKYVLLVDIDEFLIPRQHFDLLDLLQDLSSVAKKKVGSFIFSQSFFCPNKDISDDVDNFRNNLLTQQSTLRGKVWAPRLRSKVAVRPESVITGGIHFVWQHVKGWREAAVPKELALLHHYRVKDCADLDTPTEKDTSATEYGFSIEHSDIMKLWKQKYYKI